MKTNRIIIAIAGALFAIGCAHPKPVVYDDGDYLDDEVYGFDAVVSDLEQDLSADVQMILDERPIGFAGERIGAPVRFPDGFLEWKTNFALAGFEAPACAVRSVPGMFERPAADLYLYVCAARIGKGSSGDFEYDIAFEGVSGAVGGQESWTSEKTDAGTRFYERGSRIKPLGHGDIEIRREPYGEDAEQVVVTIFGIEPAKVRPGS